MSNRLRFLSLSRASIFMVSGRDAPRYLNARLSNDIRKLRPGTFCSAAMLTAQGKTQGYFQVIALPESTYLLSCDDGDRSELITNLKKFIVADRVLVEDLSINWRLLHFAPAGALPLPPPQAGGVSTQGSFSFFSHQRTEVPGLEVMGPAQDLELLKEKALALGGQEMAEEEQRLWRFRLGTPAFPDELNESSLFAEAPLRQAISFTKGCYVGQEVVERVDALGKTPRLLRHLVIQGDLRDGDKAAVNTSDGVSIGEILSSARDPERGLTWAFAYVKNRPDIGPGTKLTIGPFQAEVLR